MIGQLPGGHDLRRHHREFRIHPWKPDDGFPELDSCDRVVKCNVKRRLRDSDGTCGRLNPRGFKGLHQLPESLVLLPAKKIADRNRESVKRDFILLHAAVSDHANLASRQPRVRKG